MLEITPEEAFAMRLRAKYGIAQPMAPPTEADNDDYPELLATRAAYLNRGEPDEIEKDNDE